MTSNLQMTELNVDDFFMILEKRPTIGKAKSIKPNTIIIEELDYLSKIKNVNVKSLIKNEIAFIDKKSEIQQSKKKEKLKVMGLSELVAKYYDFGLERFKTDVLEAENIHLLRFVNQILYNRSFKEEVESHGQSGRQVLWLSGSQHGWEQNYEL